VSEAGFMMDNKTLQVILKEFVKLKKDLSGMKADISAVNAVQEELKMTSVP
jgi:hypothetical protein